MEIKQVDIMKKIYLIIFVLVAALTYSCQKPQYVLPTAERQGITSLTAFFTSGPYENQVAVKMDVDDPTIDRFVIPVPWFYPEESENPTTMHMTSMRIRAELANNCKIEPALTILDLMQENEFVFTDAQGNSRPIIITGKRTKSNVAKIMTFEILEPYVEGFVNDETDEIYLFTTDDLTGASASATVNAHSTLISDLTVVKNYNNEQTVKVMAHDGKTEKTYKITKRQPIAIPYGLRRGSLRAGFCLDAVSRLGFPKATETVYPSLAFFDRTLAVCLGEGKEITLHNSITGLKTGVLNVGAVNPMSISNDCGGNLLLFEYDQSDKECNIYTTNSVSKAPTLLYTFKNASAWHMGHHVRVNGNIDGEALIIFTHEKVGDGYDAYEYTAVEVKNRVATVKEPVSVYPVLGLTWGSAPTGAAKVCAVSNKISDGVMMSFYSSNTLYYINGNNKLAASFKVMDDSINGNYNTNNLDLKMYNNAVFGAHLITSHFPQWSCAPTLSIYDMTSPTSIKDGTSMLMAPIESFNKVEQGVAAGDVIVAQSADGFKMYVFYYDHNCQVLGSFSGDCIKLD